MVRDKKSMEEALFEELDYKSILFRQLDRIGQFSHDKQQFNGAVTTLKLFISPLANPEFNKKLKELKKDFDSEDTGKIRKRNEYKYSQGILKAVMKLFDDRNLLFTRYGYEDVPEIEMEGEENASDTEK